MLIHCHRSISRLHMNFFTDQTDCETMSYRYTSGHILPRAVLSMEAVLQMNGIHPENAIGMHMQ